MKREVGVIPRLLSSTGIFLPFCLRIFDARMLRRHSFVDPAACIYERFTYYYREVLRRIYLSESIGGH
jgi:hypothetical protein